MMKTRTLLRMGGWAVAGGAIGFAYYWSIGCVSGACPISSNPVLSTGYGALVGLIAGIGGRKVK